MKKRKFGIIISALAFVMIALPILCYCVVAYKTADRIYDCVDSIPYNDVGMVLGTGPTTVTGRTNNVSSG